jgi:hypothetical protein
MFRNWLSPDMPGMARRAYNPGLVVTGKRLRDCGVAVLSAAKFLERFVYLDNEINMDALFFVKKRGVIYLE